MLKFNCLWCGSCCEKLFKEITPEVYCGLALFPEETKFFNKDNISPYRGIGKYPEDKAFVKTLFQLNVVPCPHLKKSIDQTMCDIYEERPLTCKAYPFEIGDFNESGNPIFFSKEGCRGVQFTKEDVGKKLDENIPELLVCENVCKKVIAMPKGNMWVFDLKSREWYPAMDGRDFLKNI